MKTAFEEFTGESMEGIKDFNKDISHLTDKEFLRYLCAVGKKHSELVEKYGHNRHKETRIWRNRYKSLMKEYMRRNAVKLGMTK